jgi:hypothetical protein
MSLLLTWGLGSSAAIAPPAIGVTDFRSALVAELQANMTLSAIFGSKTFPGVIPEGEDPPAITYRIFGAPRGHNLDGADGTSVCHVQISCFSFQFEDCESAAEALRQMFDGYAGDLGGAGLVPVTETVLENEVDLEDEPTEGSDRWTFGIALDFAFHYRQSKPAR